MAGARAPGGARDVVTRWLHRYLSSPRSPDGSVRGWCPAVAGLSKCQFPWVLLVLWFRVRRCLGRRRWRLAAPCGCGIDEWPLSLEAPGSLVSPHCQVAAGSLGPRKVVPGPEWRGTTFLSEGTTSEAGTRRAAEQHGQGFESCLSAAGGRSAYGGQCKSGDGERVGGQQRRGEGAVEQGEQVVEQGWGLLVWDPPVERSPWWPYWRSSGGFPAMSWMAVGRRLRWPGAMRRVFRCRGGRMVRGGVRWNRARLCGFSRPC